MLASVRRPRSRRRGFTLVTLVMLLALASISALIIIANIEDEQDILRQHRLDVEAREAAEGGLMEMLNDQRLGAVLPDFSTQNLTATYTPPSNSVFDGTSVHRSTRDYSARIDLIRVAPMAESSHNVVQAVLYQVQVESVSMHGNSAGVEAEIYKVATTRPGVIQPRSHAR